MNTPVLPSDDMPREFKARVLHGKIEPLEELDLDEGEEVVILVQDRRKKETVKDFRQLFVRFYTLPGRTSTRLTKIGPHTTP